MMYFIPKCFWMIHCIKNKCTYKILEYEKIDISEGIDINKTNKSKKCMLCHCWYFLNNNFSCGPYLYDGCYNITRKSIDFKNITIIHIKNNAHRIYFTHMSKREEKKLMNNSTLIDKRCILSKKNFFFFIRYKNE